MKINLNKKIKITRKSNNRNASKSRKNIFREQIGKISGISQERSIDVMITRLRQKIRQIQDQNIYKL